jgi:phosphoribosylformylglycinamidine synthase subunit PurQ / glutaminase
MTRPPKIMVLHATGSNRDRDVASALELAGGEPEIVHVNQMLAGERRLADYRMLVLPGGFSYGDDLGAGKIWSVILKHRLADELKSFVAAGRPVLGICNGFQALVKSGLLPGDAVDGSQTPLATLTRNERLKFECRWVHLMPDPTSPCVFTRELTEPIRCPVAHGEGRFLARDAGVVSAITKRGGVALRYGDDKGQTSAYPWNPNGSIDGIAGICNPSGTVLGLMPHPENHIRPEQHPEFHRGRREGSGLSLFRNGVRYAAEI